MPSATRENGHNTIGDTRYLCRPEVHHQNILYHTVCCTFTEHGSSHTYPYHFQNNLKLVGVASAEVYIHKLATSEAKPTKGVKVNEWQLGKKWTPYRYTHEAESCLNTCGVYQEATRSSAPDLFHRSHAAVAGHFSFSSFSLSFS